MSKLIRRRAVVLGAGGVALAGLAAGVRASPLATTAGWEPLVRFGGDRVGMHVQRALLAGRPLAPEFGVDQITPVHPTNGGFGASYIQPDANYDHMLANGFRDWRLTIEGLVARPARFSLEQIRSMPQRTQITLHCCDMGWSAIGQWTGVPLGWLLEQVGLKDRARFVVFYCMDRLLGGEQVYSSIGVIDALHPQTILAWGMNGQTLPQRHGAPLRLRMELQIGYKNSKHIDRIAVVDSLEGIGKGHGGVFEDMGYQWYAGM